MRLGVISRLEMRRWSGAKSREIASANLMPSSCAADAAREWRGAAGRGAAGGRAAARGEGGDRIVLV